MKFGFPWLEKESGTPRAAAHRQSEPILAFRAWRIAEDALVSCTCQCIWKPRARMDAICNNNGIHAGVPAWNCYCGFYAYKTEGALAASQYVRLEPRITVQGRVALWGRVVNHGLGYRAQYAYPQVLYLRGGRFDDVVRDIAACYAIECVRLGRGSN